MRTMPFHPILGERSATFTAWCCRAHLSRGVPSSWNSRMHCAFVLHLPVLSAFNMSRIKRLQHWQQPLTKLFYPVRFQAEWAFPNLTGALQTRLGCQQKPKSAVTSSPTWSLRAMQAPLSERLLFALLFHCVPARGCKGLALAGRFSSLANIESLENGRRSSFSIKLLRWAGCCAGSLGGADTKSPNECVTGINQRIRDSEPQNLRTLPQNLRT